MLFEAVKDRAADIRIYPLYPTADKPAKRILFLCRKGSRSPTKILPGLILHGEDHGRYARKAEDILKGKIRPDLG